MRISEDPLRTKQYKMMSFSRRKWQRIKKTFGVIKELGLNNHMQQSDLYNRTEAMFSIFKFKKIDQNGLKLDNQKLIYTTVRSH